MPSATTATVATFAAGTVLDLYAADQAADAANAQAALNADALRVNAEIHDKNANLFLQQGMFENQIAQANAAALRMTAKQTKAMGALNAFLQTEVAGSKARQLRRDMQDILGAQEVAFAKAGVTPEGTPEIVIHDTAAEIELDAQILEWEGKVGATQSLLAAKFKSDQLEAQAQIHELIGQSSLILAQQKAEIAQFQATQARRHAENVEQVGSAQASSIMTNAIANAGINATVFAVDTGLFDAALGGGVPTLGGTYSGGIGSTGGYAVL